MLVDVNEILSGCALQTQVYEYVFMKSAPNVQATTIKSVDCNIHRNISSPKSHSSRTVAVVLPWLLLPSGLSNWPRLLLII